MEEGGGADAGENSHMGDEREKLGKGERNEKGSVCFFVLVL